ncbi:WXG100 family type VII secretion target [Paenibacillus sp. J22TS3]|uniref:WXG100 family type VII secretion target n=1 Tax=Paenibacillus sp. J22TS3 TaxID=2807192 RepID=UPI001B0C8AB5|nr:WXG100 family type VII secretion target [Paenibacillus sp. J22TS3]GIP21550.1 hypothetical protein J22TS3_18250 [Paenibacillus sp. J22TS3]
MMRIRMEPEQMRTLSKNLYQSAEQLRQMAASLNQLLYPLNQESGTLGTVSEQWQHAHRISEQVHAELYRIGQFVETKADAFQSLENEPGTLQNGAQIAAVGSAAAMFAGLFAVRNVILPGNYEMQGVISNPESAVQAVRNEKHQSSPAGQRWEVHPSSAGHSAGHKGNSCNSSLPHPGLSGNSPGSMDREEQELLQAAVNNPHAWKFLNPAAAVPGPLKLRRIRVVPGGRRQTSIRHLDKLLGKLNSSNLIEDNRSSDQQ